MGSWRALKDELTPAPSHASRFRSWKLSAEGGPSDANLPRATNERQQKAPEETIKTSVPANLLGSMPGTGVEPVRPLRGSGF